MYLLQIKCQNVFVQIFKKICDNLREQATTCFVLHCVATAKNLCKGCADIFRPRFVPFLATGGQVRSTACQVTTNNEILLLWSLISNGLLLKNEDLKNVSLGHVNT